MTDTDGGKSMDDVLASIRRIVRAEREATESEPESDTKVTMDAVVEDDTAEPGAASAEDPSPASPETEGESGDVPLALTPEMMSEEDVANANAVDASASTGASPAPAAGAGLAGVAKAPEPGAGDPPSTIEPADALDGDRIRDLVREVVREELAEGRAGDLVREIIKSELTTGEIGGNISRNVLRLIRSEIARTKD